MVIQKLASYALFMNCRLLQQFQSNTATSDFVYLRRDTANPAEYNPYILRVSSQLPMMGGQCADVHKPSPIAFALKLYKIYEREHDSAVAWCRLCHLRGQTRMSCTH